MGKTVHFNGSSLMCSLLRNLVTVKREIVNEQNVMSYGKVSNVCPQTKTLRKLFWLRAAVFVKANRQVFIYFLRRRVKCLYDGSALPGQSTPNMHAGAGPIYQYTLTIAIPRADRISRVSRFHQKRRLPSGNEQVAAAPLPPHAESARRIDLINPKPVYRVHKSL